jgi:hypothetical protein
MSQLAANEVWRAACAGPVMVTPAVLFEVKGFVAVTVFQMKVRGEFLPNQSSSQRRRRSGA